MRIRITPLPRDTSRFQRDGIDLSHYRVGEFYDVGSTLGTYFIVMGIAEPAMRILDQEQAGRNDHLATVLLVDDVLDQLDMYEMAIETRYRVLRASRGRDALELATRATPDIIVLDVMLPDVNGGDALSAVEGKNRHRIDPRTPDDRVCFTAHRSKRD